MAAELGPLMPLVTACRFCGGHIEMAHQAVYLGADEYAHAACYGERAPQPFRLYAVVWETEPRHTELVTPLQLLDIRRRRRRLRDLGLRVYPMSVRRAG